MSRRLRITPLLVVAVLAGCSSGHQSPVPTSSPAGSPSPTPTATDGTWLEYHADRSRTAAVGSGPSGSLTPAWTAQLGGAVRGQVLVAAGHVVATTETNRVVSLDPTTGALQWSVTLGPPLTNVAAVAGCGNIDPLGITSTPVIDPNSGTVYVVGEIDEGGGKVRHQLDGLDLATGAVRLHETVDPPLPTGERAVHLLQRASLALGNGRVYVSFGGNDGDCGDYHGWVVGVSETGPPQLVSFEVADDGAGGAIWQAGGAPAVDATGDLYVSTGNANPDPPEGGPDPKKFTESVVKLTPELVPVASYKDRVAGGDEDLSTGNPVLLPNGDLFTVGKTDIGFLLRQTDLHEIAQIPGICGSDPDGGPAFDAVTNRIFVPCRDGGVQVVDLAARRVGARLAGADSAPILVGSTLWALDHDQGQLAGYDAKTGRLMQKLAVASQLPIFNSPSVGAGLLLVGTTTGVVAFRG